MNRGVSIVVSALVAAFALLSCQSPAGTSDVDLAPPEWIIGTWSDAAGVFAFSFTRDAVVSSIESDGVVTTVDYALLYGYSGVADIGTASSYTLTLSPDASGGVHEFFDNGDATLDYFFTASGLKTGPLVLMRR